MIRTEEDLHVWRARPGVFGVGDSHGLVLRGAEHPWVPVVQIQQLQGAGSAHGWCCAGREEGALGLCLVFPLGCWHPQASSNARAWALGDLKVATHYSRGRNLSWWKTLQINSLSSPPFCHLLSVPCWCLCQCSPAQAVPLLCCLCSVAALHECLGSVTHPGVLGKQQTGLG